MLWQRDPLLVKHLSQKGKGMQDQWIWLMLIPLITRAQILSHSLRKTLNFPYSKAIIIKENIGGAEVQCRLVDNRGSCDVLFLDAFIKMGIKPSCLKPFPKMITLPLTLSEWPKITTEMVDFLIMDIPSAYNGILDRTSQTLMGVILSVRHQVIKFSIKHGVGSINGASQHQETATTPK